MHRRPAPDPRWMRPTELSKPSRSGSPVPAHLSVWHAAIIAAAFLVGLLTGYAMFLLVPRHHCTDQSPAVLHETTQLRALIINETAQAERSGRRTCARVRALLGQTQRELSMIRRQVSAERRTASREFRESHKMRQQLSRDVAHHEQQHLQHDEGHDVSALLRLGL